MEPKLDPAENSSVNSTDVNTDAESPTVEVNPKEGSILDKLTNGDANPEDWQQILKRVYAFLSKLPEPVMKFFNEYRQLIIIIAAGFGAFVSVKVLLAMLGALNEIPLVAPTFEMVGIFYAGWLIFRYAPTAEKRQDFQKDFNSIKDRVLGNKDTEGSEGSE